jgi:hypothetical protein
VRERGREGKFKREKIVKRGLLEVDVARGIGIDEIVADQEGEERDENK